jgi:primosomal protein N' (replication factor Y)
MFAQVVVLTPVDTGADTDAYFTYGVPDDLRNLLVPGSLVTIPFGTRKLYGVVVGLSEESAIPRTRPVESVVDPQPAFTPDQLELAGWLSHEYLASLHECLSLMIPSGLVGHADVIISLNPEAPPQAARTKPQAALLALLERRGPLHGRQLTAALPGVDWRPAADQLVRRAIVSRESFLGPPRAQPKHIETIQLDPATDVEVALKGLRSDVYDAIVAFLRAEGTPVDISWVYAATGAKRYHLKKLGERGVVTLGVEEVWRDPLAGQVFVPAEPPALTSDQQTVWDRVRRGLEPEGASAFLIHGVTGSGKTEIYLRAVAHVLAQGRQALILIPEIALTPQTVTRFGARFPGRIGVLHSALTEGERYDAWRRARTGLVDIMIGPRSALFSPLRSLGLIVLDEEHDSSYKQAAPRPRYHARDAALQRARLTGATVILGSATPSLESFQRAKRDEITLLEMPRRIMGHVRRLHDLQTRYRVREMRYTVLRDGPPESRYRSLPPVQVVDLRAELRAGNRSIFSRTLQRAIDTALEQREQVILFLNRRGTATFVLCRDCGHVLSCPRCNIPLTHHTGSAKLTCHHCNHHAREPGRCPQCGSARIRYFGLGTERVETAVSERWPNARIIRWDRDTARSHDAHADILHRFADRMADVLVGTQMVAKGLDLPLVTVVGVISADTMLNLPDFRASERTFQLLTQVAGRAGRGLLSGQVVVQTYHPDHYAVTAAAGHDYAAFAARELAFRRELGYPPYRRLTRLVYGDENPSRARAEARAVARKLREALRRWGLPNSDLIGPAPCFFARVRDRYRWHMILRHPRPAEFLREMPLPRGWRVDVDPSSVL